MLALYIDGITSLWKTFFNFLMNLLPAALGVLQLPSYRSLVWTLVVSLTMDIVLQPSFEQRISSENISPTAYGSTRLLHSSMH